MLATFMLNVYRHGLDFAPPSAALTNSTSVLDFYHHSLDRFEFQRNHHIDDEIRFVSLIDYQSPNLESCRGLWNIRVNNAALLAALKQSDSIYTDLRNLQSLTFVAKRQQENLVIVSEDILTDFDGHLSPLLESQQKMTTEALDAYLARYHPDLNAALTLIASRYVHQEQRISRDLNNLLTHILAVIDHLDTSTVLLARASASLSEADGSARDD